MHKAISKFYINILICDYFVVTLVPKNYTMLCVIPTPLKKQRNLDCYYKVTVWELT